MHLSKAAAVATLLITSGTIGALAHDNAPVDRVQSRQIQSIEDGRRTGTITRREYRGLMAEQDRIAALERSAEADGRVTRREVRAIREAQHEARANIAREQSDGQVNLWRRWKSRHGL